MEKIDFQQFEMELQKTAPFSLKIFSILREAFYRFIEHRATWMGYLVFELALAFVIRSNLLSTGSYRGKEVLLLVAIGSLMYVGFVLNLRWAEILLKGRSIDFGGWRLPIKGWIYLYACLKLSLLFVCVGLIPLCGFILSLLLYSRLFLYSYPSLLGCSNGLKLSWWMTKGNTSRLFSLVLILSLPLFIVQVFYQLPPTALIEKAQPFFIYLSLSLIANFFSTSVQCVIWQQVSSSVLNRKTGKEIEH